MKWMISCDFFCLTFDRSRGYGEEKNPVLTGTRHSDKNSSVEGSPWVRKIVGTLRWKTRVTESWLVLMPHLIGWKVGPSFPGQSQQSLITFWASIRGVLGGRFPAFCNSRSATSQVHTANQLPAILFRDVFLESVQKPFSIITSDYIKFPAQNSRAKCTSPVYQRRNSYPYVRGWAIAFNTI